MNGFICQLKIKSKRFNVILDNLCSSLNSFKVDFKSRKVYFKYTTFIHAKMKIHKTCEPLWNYFFVNLIGKNIKKNLGVYELDFYFGLKIIKKDLGTKICVFIMK
jgi:hypothetical protein